MRTRIATTAALRALPESWGLILATIGTGRRAWSTTAEIETPDREAIKAGRPPIDAGPCAAMEVAGWLARWEVFDRRGAVTEDKDASVDENVPPPGIVAWTLTPWAADALGLELDEPGGDDRPARWVEVRRDEDGRPLAITRPIVAPWHRWERLAPWIERLSEDRRKALMASGGPREPETLKDERSGEEIRLFAGPDGKGAGVAILRDLKELGKAGRKMSKGSKGKAKGKRKRRAG